MEKLLHDWDDGMDNDLNQFLNDMVKNFNLWEKKLVNLTAYCVEIDRDQIDFRLSYLWSRPISEWYVIKFFNWKEKVNKLDYILRGQRLAETLESE